MTVLNLPAKKDNFKVWRREMSIFGPFWGYSGTSLSGMAPIPYLKMTSESKGDEAKCLLLHRTSKTSVRYGPFY